VAEEKLFYAQVSVHYLNLAAIFGVVMDLPKNERNKKRIVRMLETASAAISNTKNFFSEADPELYHFDITEDVAVVRNFLSPIYWTAEEVGAVNTKYRGFFDFYQKTLNRVAEVVQQLGETWEDRNDPIREKFQTLCFGNDDPGSCAERNLEDVRLQVSELAATYASRAKDTPPVERIHPSVDMSFDPFYKPLEVTLKAYDAFCTQYTTAVDGILDAIVSIQRKKAARQVVQCAQLNKAIYMCREITAPSRPPVAVSCTFLEDRLAEAKKYLSVFSDLLEEKLFRKVVSQPPPCLVMGEVPEFIRRWATGRVVYSDVRKVCVEAFRTGNPKLLMDPLIDSALVTAEPEEVPPGEVTPEEERPVARALTGGATGDETDLEGDEDVDLGEDEFYDIDEDEGHDLEEDEFHDLEEDEDHDLGGDDLDAELEGDEGHELGGDEADVALGPDEDEVEINLDSIKELELDSTTQNLVLVLLSFKKNTIINNLVAHLQKSMIFFLDGTKAVSEDGSADSSPRLDPYVFAARFVKKFRAKKRGAIDEFLEETKKSFGCVSQKYEDEKFAFLKEKLAEVQKETKKALTVYEKNAKQSDSFFSFFEENPVPYVSGKDVVTISIKAFLTKDASLLDSTSALKTTDCNTLFQKSIEAYKVHRGFDE
jgi:hypothetical protein